MIRFARFAAAGIAAVCLSAGASAQAPTPEAPLKVTYATYLNPSVAFVQVDDWFMKEITARSNGAIQFETYYGGALLSALDIYPGLASGAVDIAMGAPGYNVDMLPLSSVPQPFITEKVDAAMKAIRDLYNNEPEFRTEWQQNGLEMLYPMVAGENAFFLNKKVIETDDLAGMRIRSTLGIAEALNILGATTVALPSPDAIEGLKRGAIEGIGSLPFDTAMSLGLHEIASFVSDSGRMGIYVIMATAANKGWWDSLDPSVRDLFTEVAAEVPQKYLELMNSELTTMAEQLHTTSTIEVLTQSDEEIALWQEQAAEGVWNKWLADMSGKGIDGAAILAQYRELVAKYEPESAYRTGLDIYREEFEAAK